jgi:hypothetical protein
MSLRCGSAAHALHGKAVINPQHYHGAYRLGIANIDTWVDVDIKSRPGGSEAISRRGGFISMAGRTAGVSGRPRRRPRHFPRVGNAGYRRRGKLV